MPCLRWRLVGCAAVALGLTFLAEARADDGAWVGKVVVVKKAGTKVSRTDESGEHFDFTLGDTLAYRVEAEKGPAVLIRDRGISVWLAKSDALLPDDALDYFTHVIASNPTDADAHARRASARMAVKGDLDLALKDSDKAIRLDPTTATWRRARGFMWYEKGEYEKAVADYTDAVRLDPKNDANFVDRGCVWLAKCEYDKALADYEKAIRLNPECALAFVGRGSVAAAKKDYAKALADYDEALRLDSTQAWTHGARAGLLAACPDDKVRDGKQAVVAARKACELTAWKEAQYIAVLAAAYAKVGDFDGAVEWQNKALEFADYEKQVGEDARTCLKLYEKHQPLRVHSK